MAPWPEFGDKVVEMAAAYSVLAPMSSRAMLVGTRWPLQKQNSTLLAVEEAVKGAQFVVGTSARERRIPWPLQDARHCGERLYRHAMQGEEVVILFGREFLLT